MMEKALNIVSSPSSLKDDDRHRIDSGRPIRFVYFDENDNLRLDSDAIDVLQRNKRPVAVVSIFGPPRQGKSFILNQLLGKSSGFQIASNHRSCTKGLWMWSEPLKRITLDGTEYDLLLFDPSGINCYDQTGMHSTKIFTLAVLLSSMFIYNQVGPIDEAALDHLSLVTELTKHIHVRASERNDSISEFECCSPVFMWLLRDFYMDLMEDNTRITPHDYLKHALRPVLASGKDIATKNQIGDSIRAVFPNQECFTLVRPLNNETELQHLDQVSLDKFRPEFRSGLDFFMKFIYDRTRPRQVGGSTVTGPFLATITKFFLDVLNSSTIPTIPSSWQLHARDAFMEADSHSSEVIKSMEKKLQEAFQVANATLGNIAEVLESLISEYELSVHGPSKWQKLSLFLRKSLQGPILLHAKKLINQISLEKSSLLLKCSSNEDKLELLCKQLEASHKLQAEYQKRYDDAIKDFKKVSDQYKSRIRDLEQKCSILEERCSSSLEMLDSANMDSLRWERKYQGTLAEKGADNEQVNAKTAVLRSGVCVEAATIAAATESLQLALKEAHEWKEKYDAIVNESKDALEKAAEQARHREETLRAEFTDSLAEKDKEIKKMLTKVEDSEQRLTSLTSYLKAAETKIENYDLESSTLKLQIIELAEKHELVKASYESMEKETKMLTEARIQLEEKYSSELKRFEEAHERLKILEKEAKMHKNIETAQMEGFSSQNVNSGSQQLIIDSLAQNNSAHNYTETLETEKEDLLREADRSAISADDAILKIALLEAMVRDRDEEIELLKKKCEQSLSLIPVHDGSFETEYAARQEANRMEESPSWQPEPTQENLNLLEQELIPEYSEESSHCSDLKTYSGNKRSRLEFSDLALCETPVLTTGKSTSALRQCTTGEVDSAFKVEESDYQNVTSVDYTKLTVMKLRKELQEHGFGGELQKLKHPKKKDILALYKKLVLKE